MLGLLITTKGNKMTNYICGYSTRKFNSSGRYDITEIKQKENSVRNAMSKTFDELHKMGLKTGCPSHCYVGDNLKPLTDVGLMMAMRPEYWGKENLS